MPPQPVLDHRWLRIGVPILDIEAFPGDPRVLVSAPHGHDYHTAEIVRPDELPELLMTLRRTIYGGSEEATAQKHRVFLSAAMAAILARNVSFSSYIFRAIKPSTFVLRSRTTSVPIVPLPVLPALAELRLVRPNSLVCASLPLCISSTTAMTSASLSSKRLSLRR